MALLGNGIGARLKAVFTENLTAKLMALAMALAVWFYAYNFSVVRGKTYSAPLKLLPPPGWAVVGGGTGAIDVTLDFSQRFEREVEQAYRSGQIRVECHLRPAEDGPDRQRITVSFKWPRHLVTPRDYGIRKVEFSPPSLQVEVVKETVVELPVRLRHTAPPEDFQLAGEPSVTPGRVRVRGRKDVLAEATDISTETVDISRALRPELPGWEYEGTIALQQKVVVGGEEYAVRSADKVHYVIKLERRPAEKRFERVPVHMIVPANYPYGVEFVEEPIRGVVVRGAASVISKLNQENLVLYVLITPAHEPRELAQPMPIYADFVDIGGESTLTVELSKSTIDVRVKKRP